MVFACRCCNLWCSVLDLVGLLQNLHLYIALYRLVHITSGSQNSLRTIYILNVLQPRDIQIDGII